VPYRAAEVSSQSDSRMAVSSSATRISDPGKRTSCLGLRDGKVDPRARSSAVSRGQGNAPAARRRKSARDLESQPAGAHLGGVGLCPCGFDSAAAVEDAEPDFL